MDSTHIKIAVDSDNEMSTILDSAHIKIAVDSDIKMSTIRSKGSPLSLAFQSRFNSSGCLLHDHDNGKFYQS